MECTHKKHDKAVYSRPLKKPNKSLNNWTWRQCRPLTLKRLFHGNFFKVLDFVSNTLSFKSGEYCGVFDIDQINIFNNNEERTSRCSHVCTKTKQKTLTQLTVAQVNILQLNKLWITRWEQRKTWPPSYWRDKKALLRCLDFFPYPEPQNSFDCVGFFYSNLLLRTTYKD